MACRSLAGWVRGSLALLRSQLKALLTSRGSGCGVGPWTRSGVEQQGAAGVLACRGASVGVAVCVAVGAGSCCWADRLALWAVDDVGVVG